MASDKLKKHFATIGAVRGDLLMLRLLKDDKTGTIQEGSEFLFWKWLDETLAMLDEDIEQLRTEGTNEQRPYTH